MKQYYRDHPEYAQGVKDRAKAQRQRLFLEDPEVERERSRQRCQERRRRGLDKPTPKQKRKARDRRRQQGKDKATRALLYSIRVGKVTRPDVCQDCGQVGKVEGHHHDYTRAFDVKWLCKRCHGKQHQKSQPAPFSVPQAF